MTSFHRAILAASIALTPFLAFAAEPATRGFKLLDSITAGYSYTAETDLRNNAGELTVQRYEFEVNGRTTLSSRAAFSHGIGLVRTELDRAAASLLPKTLQELSVRLGWQWQRDANWRLNASVRPGFYGDRSAIDNDTFNAPFLGLASYIASRELIWSFGVIANGFSDNPVLPVGGVRWRFAPAWLLNLGYPRAGLAWEYTSSTTFTAGATFQGGAYRLTRNPVALPAGFRPLANEKLDYREIRLGIGGTFQLARELALTIDAGVTVDQRFEYHDRGLEQRGDSAGFAAVALTGRF